MAGYNQSPRFVEDKVIEWLRELMGYPEGTTGMLLSGASMANLTALAVARHVHCFFFLKENGIAFKALHAHPQAGKGRFRVRTCGRAIRQYLWRVDCIANKRAQSVVNLNIFV
jgi:hypothetical protein